MDYKITGYEPAQLFHFFEEVSAIPRGSGNEKGISDFLVAFAKERGLDVYQDEVYNVIIRKPASAGAENAPTVMLQGHIDMVCDKLGSVEHDFTTDGIDLVVKDGILTANGTTLGADNGIAVALMLTVLDDDSIVHPALECVFTTDEETGLVGDVTIDESSMQVTKAGQPVSLTKKEYELLLLFARNQNMALFRETIYERVWDGEYTGDSRTVDLHVQRLRKKLGWQDRLSAVYKVGYRLEVKE